MTYASEIERQALIAGFHALADFLHRNPDVPAPKYADILMFPTHGSETDRHAEIDAIASRIGSGTETYGGHYTTSRKFGPVEYRAVFIPRSDQEEW